MTWPMSDSEPEATVAGGDASFDVAIVDDRITNRTIFSQLAASVGPGVRVHAFGDPVEALAWLDAAGADLVITDYRMPGMDGDEFVSRLRALPEGKEVPVVVVTAYADRGLRLRALEAGATDFLHSPVDPHEFRTRARNLLTMSHQRRLLRGRAAELAAELEESEASRRRAVRESRERLAQVIDTVPAMISAADREGHCVFVNAHQTAYQAALPPPAPGEDGGCPPPLFGRVHQQRSRALDGRVFETGQALPPYEEEVRDAGGERRVLLTIKAPLRDGDGAVTSVLTTSLDITDRKRAEERLGHLARHDGLTGLLNRGAFRERLQRELAKVTRGDRGFALHYVDLDHFKRVNDGFGHHAGDLLLRAAADRLGRTVEGEGVVARLGGDEFGVLQFAPADRRCAAALAERIIEVLASPFTVEGAPVCTGASIGVTRCPRDGRGADELLRNADSAMYRAKLAGRGGYRFFNDDGGENEADPADELRRDLARKRLVLHYQPQFGAGTGAVVGAEALLRWWRHGWGLLAPGAFLPAAERGGLALPLGEWVLHEACSQAARWQRTHAAPVRVSVNVSPTQAREAGLAWTVRGVLEASGLPPGLLTLELTEDLLADGSPSLLAALAELRAVGVRVCLDNFGVGGLPLVSLQRGPVDCVKIDRSLVQGDDAAAFEAAVALGRLLAAEVLAAGVETAQQLARARAAKCDVLQGFHLGKPGTAEEFATWLPDKPPAWPAAVG